MPRGLDNMEAPRFESVPVPVDLVEEVYAFIARRRAAGLGEAVADAHLREQAPAAEKEDDEWDEGGLGELLDHGNPKLRLLLEHLARHPSEDWIAADEVLPAAGVPMGRGAGGWFSRLNRSSQSRYGHPLPVDSDWDYEAGRMVYRLPTREKKIISSLLDRGH
jgi:hypothetical protein